MIRRLIILLLIVGCEEGGLPIDDLGSNGTAVTDTVYVYDTLIVNFDTTLTQYDTTIINFDSLIFDFDTTIVTTDTLIYENSDCMDTDSGDAYIDACGT